MEPCRGLPHGYPAFAGWAVLICIFRVWVWVWFGLKPGRLPKASFMTTLMLPYGKGEAKDERQKVPLLCLKHTVPLSPCQSPHQDGGEFCALILERRKPRPRAAGRGLLHTYVQVSLLEFRPAAASGGIRGPWDQRGTEEQGIFVSEMNQSGQRDHGPDLSPAPGMTKATLRKTSGGRSQRTLRKAQQAMWP